MNNTTRRYPRSLQAAFPQDHAEAIEHYANRGASALRFLIWLAACIVIGICAGSALA